MAKKNKVEISKDLVSELEKYSTNVCIGMATFVRDTMTEKAEEVITSFYAHYTPIYYKRHEEHYNFMENSFTKYYSNPHNQIVRGGVELTPQNIEDIYRANPEYVFNLVYLGFHGNVKMLPNYENIKNVPPEMSPNPLELLLNRRDYIIENIDRYKKYGLNRANKDSYSFF